MGINRDVHGKIVQADNDVVIYQPFKVLVQLWNKTKQAVGPMSLVLKRGEHLFEALQFFYLCTSDGFTCVPYA